MPIITDSGGFQVFSLAYGSVANELKSRGQKKQGGLVLNRVGTEKMASGFTMPGNIGQIVGGPAPPARDVVARNAIGGPQ